MTIQEYLWKLKDEKKMVERIEKLAEAGAPCIILLNEIKWLYYHRQKFVFLDKIDLYGQLEFVRFSDDVFELPDGNKIVIAASRWGKYLKPEKQIVGIVAQKRKVEFKNLCRFVKKYLYRLALKNPKQDSLKMYAKQVELFSKFEKGKKYKIKNNEGEFLVKAMKVDLNDVRFKLLTATVDGWESRLQSYYLNYNFDDEIVSIN